MSLNPASYKYWSFDLSRARVDEPLGLSGTDIIVFKLTNPVEIRLDDIRNDRIPLTSCDPITPINISGIPFKEIYLTNDSVRGTMQIIVLFGGTSSQIVDELRKPRGIDRVLSKLGLV